MTESTYSISTDLDILYRIIEKYQDLLEKIKKSIEVHGAEYEMDKETISTIARLEVLSKLEFVKEIINNMDDLNVKALYEHYLNLKCEYLQLITGCVFSRT
jgi:hypothetical protein